MAISDVLLEGGHTFKTYSTRAERVGGGYNLKISGRTSFMDDPVLNFGWSGLKSIKHL